MLYDFYLAGPFFNEQQQALIKMIGDICIHHDRKVYVPMEHKLNSSRRKLTYKDAEEVKEENKRAIFNSEHVLAVMDYLLPEDSQLGIRHHYSFTPLILPDIGTTWELGYSEALNKKVVLFSSTIARWNVMLVHGALGIVTSLKQLDAYARALDPTLLSPVTGDLY